MQFRSNKFPEAFIVKKELNVYKRNDMEAGSTIRRPLR